MVYKVLHNLDKLILWSHLPPLLPPTHSTFQLFPQSPGPFICGFANATPLPEVFPTFLSKCTCLHIQPLAYWLLPGHLEALPLHFCSAAC